MLGPAAGQQPTSSRRCCASGCARRRARVWPPSAACPPPTASGWSTRSPTTRSDTGRSRSSWPTTRSRRSWSTAPRDIWIERRGRLYQTGVRFSDEAHLRRIITKIAGQVGRRVDESSPMLDARLPDGSRVNACSRRCRSPGSLLTIRKFGRERYSLDDMVRLGTLTREAVELLQACLHAELNILVSGGTGSGKTTLLNAMSGEISERRADRHDRGCGGAAAQPGARSAPRIAACEHRGRGPGHDPRPRPQRTAHAARPHRRRRGPRRRGAGHAAGDEHRPRRVARARCTRTRRATRCRASRRWS